MDMTPSSVSSVNEMEEMVTNMDITDRNSVSAALCVCVCVCACMCVCVRACVCMRIIK